MSEDFGGFSTPETLTVDIWIGADQNNNAFVRDVVRQYSVEEVASKQQEIADEIFNYFDEQIDDLDNNFAKDLASSALRRVKWTELASKWIFEFAGVYTENY